MLGGNNWLRNMKKYKFYSSSIIGNEHKKRNMPCQDYSLAVYRNETYFAIVCDGCGSAGKSDQGSKLVAEELSNYVSNNFDSLYAKDGCKAKRDINFFVRRVVVDYAVFNNFNPNDMLCTYLFVAIKDDKHIICQLGDGGIVAAFQDGRYAVFEEAKTDEANLTHYFNYDNYLSVMNLDKGDDVLTGAFLFTDGISNDASIGEEEIKTITKYINYATSHSGEEIKEVIDKLLMNQLAETNDDCSIAIVAIDDTSLETSAIIGKPTERVFQSKIIKMTEAQYKRIFALAKKRTRK